MWEFLIKINPKFIRFYKDYDNFDYYMDIALKRGYLPSYSDIKRNYELNSYLLTNKDLFKRCIKNDPNCIELHHVSTGSTEELVEYAIECGYKPSVEVVKKNDILASVPAVFRELIRENPSNIIYYNGYSDSIFQEAINLGWKPNVEEVKQHNHLAFRDLIMSILVSENPENIRLYRGDNSKLVELAIEKGFVPSASDIKKIYVFSIDSNFMMKLIKDDPRNIIYYNGSDETLFDEAINLGYIPSKEDFKNYNLHFSDKIFEKLIKKDPNLIIFYRGDDYSLVGKAIEYGYEPKIKDLEKNYRLTKSDDVIRKLIEQNPNNIIYYSGDNYKIFEEAIALGYKPKLKDLQKSDFLAKSDFFIRKLIERNPKYVVYYEGYDQTIIEEAIKLGYKPKIKDLEKCFCLHSNDKVMMSLISKDANVILEYGGSSEKVFELAIKRGFRPTKKQLHSNNNLCRSDAIMKYSIERDPSSIVLYKGDNVDLISLAIERGYNPTKEDVMKNHFLASNPKIAYMLIAEDPVNINLFKNFNDEAMVAGLKAYEELYNVNLPDYYAEILKAYRGDLNKFCLRYSEFSNFLLEVGIDEEMFYQWAFLKSDNWHDTMFKIIDSGEIENFKKIKDFFFENFYSSEMIKKQNYEINSFLNLLKNYSLYPELCNDIINQNRKLTEEEIINLNLLFKLSDVFDNSNKPVGISDLGKVVENLKNIYSEKFKSDNMGNMDSVKSILCELLFDANYYEVIERLFIYGDTQVLRQLLFNNRNNSEVVEQIKNMMVCTSLMEDIVNISDVRVLKQVVDRALENFGEVSKLMVKFGDYEENMRILYESDIKQNLTTYTSMRNVEDVVDKERTAKYGVEVLDFSDKKYCLLTHVMSRRENPEDLVNGIASNNKRFICLSSISNRNQVYYTNPGSNKIIFAADVLPDGLFLQSSTSNMGSNSYIKGNGIEIEEISRKQRGIVETSHAERGNNSEILAYRGGLEFRYIVLHGGREPTEEELRIAKEYGLKFIVTQPVRMSVENPKKIEMIEKSSEEQENHEEVVGGREDSKVSLVPKSFSKQKRIAILTDAHGLFEPTLAVLEDARKRGIEEIYSLGDNIGTGPSPSEVMDLLEEYGVVSVIGNHELYITEGVDAFKDHLDRAGSHAYPEALRSSGWTAEQITDEQKQKLRMCDKMIEVVLGGKKILLCHDIKNFNTDEVIVDASVYDEVFRGHKHFKKEDGNITTIPGVGIGTNAGMATYLILTENEGGGYSKDFITVKYDTTSLGHTISESDMSVDDKSKIESWAGVSSGRKGK